MFSSELFSKLLGRVISRIERAEQGSEYVVFHMDDGSAYRTYHSQDCCEGVAVHRIEGSISDVCGEVITGVVWDEYPNGEPAPEYVDPTRAYRGSWTWTRQQIITGKGQLVIVWLGESNGYYSETPVFDRTHGDVV
jgi:hypothetical protein